MKYFFLLPKLFFFSGWMIFLVTFGCVGFRTGNEDFLLRERIVLLISNFEESRATIESYKSSLSILGIVPEIITLNKVSLLEIGKVKLLIVPEDVGAKLEEEFIQKIIKEVSQGLLLITEGDSSLTRALGLKFGKEEISARILKDFFHPEIKIVWPASIQVKVLNPECLKIFCSEKFWGVPLLTGGYLGQGRFLYLGVPLDSFKGRAYICFPYFHEALREFFDLKPFFRRERLMVYLDWGFHYKEDPDLLAEKLKGYGVSEVHLSCWYTLERCSDFFNKFINACHLRGMLVYCWFELPMVTTEFWNQHPEWREKTATGEDALVDWRYLMALEIPECREAVKKEMSKVIDAFDWDGIDLAELYFESPLGLDQLKYFTPFSSEVRKDFQKRYGIDPLEFFLSQSQHFYKNKPEAFKNFLRYRSELCYRLHRELLLFLKEKRQRGVKRPLDLMVTQVDSILDKRMRENLAVDIDWVIRLQNELGFNLQIEDPYSLWSKEPERYRILGEAYQKRIKAGSRFTIDINIVDRPDNPYPTSRQSGLEFLTLLSEASCHAEQVCIYAAHTPFDFDYKYASYALAAGAQLKEVERRGDRIIYKVKSPSTVLMELDTRKSKFLLNGKIWPCVNEKGVLLPRGDNSLEAISMPDGVREDLLITDLSAEKFECEVNSRGIILKYWDHRNVYITFNKKPAKIVINGQEASLPIFLREKGVTYSCPPGLVRIEFFEG